MYYAGNDASKTYAIGILNTRFHELFIITWSIWIREPQGFYLYIEIEIVFEAM